jgi:hypothetical protein
MLKHLRELTLLVSGTAFAQSYERADLVRGEQSLNTAPC